MGCGTSKPQQASGRGGGAWVAGNECVLSARMGDVRLVALDGQVTRRILMPC